MITTTMKHRLNFTTKAKAIHGDKYDYSNSIYINSKTPISILCILHKKEFLQMPTVHLRGSGCPTCGKKTIGLKQRSNTQEFIKKAVEKHGNKYDYSKVEYINNTSKIIIICKDHGEYTQQPNNHLMGKKCKLCSIENIRLQNRSNTQEFIKKAITIHGDIYDYSKVDYIDNTTKVIIKCPIHQEFEQNPADHLSGNGCQKCGIIKSHQSQTFTTEMFIEKAMTIHGENTYDYSKVEYVGSHSKVIIICKKHGEFEQTPCSHTRQRAGCIQCGIIKSSLSKTSTTKEFIENAMTIHGDKYDYSKSIYTKRFELLIVICKIHGEFIQRASEHLSGCGCKKCSKVYSPTTIEFIDNAVVIHGDKYDYSKVEYNKAIIKIIIICKKHGEFEQTPNSHLCGNGCSKCSKRGYSMKAVKYLDFISSYHKITIQHAENDGEYMITNTNYKADGYCKETNTIYEFHGTIYHGDPRCCNPDENNYLGKNYGELHRRTLEREQCIRYLGYKLVIIWEKDWDNVIRTVIKLQRKYRKSK